MSDILNNNSENKEMTDKERLEQRRIMQAEIMKNTYKTDKQEKEEAIERMKAEKELEEQLRPYISVRKICIGICVFMWFFAAFCLLSGTLEMKIFFPMCLFALCALAAVNVPIFLKKGKTKDGIIAAIAAIICFATGALIFVLG